MNLGINGLGRIGKLSLWHHVSRKHFSGLVVNIGRNVGAGLQDLAAAIERDSTYGRLGTYLHGHRTGRVIQELDEANGQADVIHLVQVDPNAGSYAIPAVLTSGQALKLGGDYVFNVQLIDTRGDPADFIATGNQAEILRRSSSFFLHASYP